VRPPPARGPKRAGLSGRRHRDHSAARKNIVNGLPTPKRKRQITAWLESKNSATRASTTKLRDWLFCPGHGIGGEPFPIGWQTGADGSTYHEALPRSAIPILPPPLEAYKPTPTAAPLARAKGTAKPSDGSTAKTNTMPQWAGRCGIPPLYIDSKRTPRPFAQSRRERNTGWGHSVVSRGRVVGKV